MRSQRVNGFISLVLRSARAGEFNAVLRNASTTGLALKTSAPLSVSDELEVLLAKKYWIKATVRWMKDGQMGVEFDQPLTEEMAQEAVRPPKINAPTQPIYAESLIQHVRQVQQKFPVKY